MLELLLGELAEACRVLFLRLLLQMVDYFA